jgi:hypothetical protein
MILFLQTYDYLYFDFDFIFICYVHASIVYYKQVMIAFQLVQVVTILQQVAMFRRSSSPLPHILASAPLSLVDLWQRMPF